MRSSEQINELAAALAKAQGQMKAAKKSEDNPYFRSKYADLANVVENERKALADNGLSVVQGLSATVHNQTGDFQCVTVTTRLLHSSGQWLEDCCMAVPKDFGAQSVGALCSYLRRYGRMAITGSTAEGEDDDGEEASGRGKHENPKFVKGPKPEGTLPNEKNAVNPIDEKLTDLRSRFSKVKESGMFTQAELKKMNDEVSKVKENVPSIEFLVGKFELDLADRQKNQKEYLDKVFEAGEKAPDIL